MLYSHMQHHNDTIINQTQEDFFIKICSSHFIARVRKGLLKVCVWEGVGDWTEVKYFDPKLMAVNVVSFSFFWCLAGALGSTLPGAGFLYCSLSASSLDPKLHRGSRGPPRSGVTFPTTSRLSLFSNSTGTPTGSSNSTQLYNRSTPTRSLKSNV